MTDIVVVSDDLRSTHRTREAWRDPERRRLYLLRSDVAVPLSADPRVTLPADAEADAWRLVVSLHRDDQEGAATAQFPDGSVDRPFGSWEPPHGAAADLPRLGFDVCDRDRYSALLGCGYDDEVREELRRVWAAKLDAHHLLRTLDDARSFRRAADARVREHAPFFVMRVHGIRAQITS